MQVQGNPFRSEIESLIRQDDLNGLLRKAGELHGHWCNYLAYGVKAGYYGVKEMGITNTGMEEVIAIVECNNCFSDGIQVITGCSFGNNSLIYRDWGKTAVTITRRDGQSIRIALDPAFEDSRGEEYPDAYKLFDKIVVKRQPAEPEEYAEMMRLFSEMSAKELSVPFDKMFRITKMTINIPEFAPIFESKRCSVCGENVMVTRLIEKEGRHFCIGCSGTKYNMLDGEGISIKK